MRTYLSLAIVVGLLGGTSSLGGCKAAPPADPSKPATTSPAATPAATTAEPVAEAPVPIPISPTDPSWGSPDAPVTIVELADFQCPFCDHARTTLEDLKEAYGPSKLRVVWKHHPLSFHKDAAGAARAAGAIFVLDGSDAFWAAHHALFNRQSTLADATRQLMDRAAAAHKDLVPALAEADKAIADDEAFAEAARVTGTPQFFVNGVRIAGAQPAERFKAVIDEQLQKAAALVAKGVPPNKVYGELTRAQYGVSNDKPERLDFSSPRAPEIFKLPVAKSPVRGPKDALATLVLVTDLSCESCRLFAANVAEVMATRKDKARLVIRFSRAYRAPTDAALHVAIEARSRKGEAAFWKAYDAFANEKDPGDAALSRVAVSAGLPEKQALEAASARKHKAEIDADEESLDEAGTSWVPSLFVNGHSASAFSSASLAKAVDQEIAAAEKIASAGTPRDKLYEKILEAAKPPAEPERKSVPAPPKSAPSHGPASSKAVIQIFGNFESSQTDRLFAAVEEIDKDFPGKVRVVFRQVPHAAQPGSWPAAEVACEAFAERGEDGFWSMAKLLFGGRARIDGFERGTLLGYGAQLGLDAAKLTNALDKAQYKDDLTAEIAAYRQAGLEGPTLVLGDMVVGGSKARLRRLVRRALSSR